MRVNNGSSLENRTMNSRRNLLALSIAGVLGTGSLLPVAAPAAEGSLAMEEVIVTAQKRRKNLQDVGISVTAFSGEQMKDFGFSEATDIVAQTPGLAVARPGAGAINMFSIRGVTQGDFAGNQEGPVAVYVDEAYVSLNTVTNFTMFDLERVEVLRGPQGTLFGRNATGGLVHYVTAKPSQERAPPLSHVRLQGPQARGSRLRRRPRDTVAGRIAAVWNTSDDLMENLIGPDGQGNDWAVRGQLLIEPSDTFSVLLKAEYVKSDNARRQLSPPRGRGRRVRAGPCHRLLRISRRGRGGLLVGRLGCAGFNKADVKSFTAKVEWKVGKSACPRSRLPGRRDDYAEDSEGSPSNVFNYTQATDVQPVVAGAARELAR